MCGALRVVYRNHAPDQVKPLIIWINPWSNPRGASALRRQLRWCLAQGFILHTLIGAVSPPETAVIPAFLAAAAAAAVNAAAQKVPLQCLLLKHLLGASSDLPLQSQGCCLHVFI